MITPAVNTVVDVFMERRLEYLPRLTRIAEVIAGCTRASLSDHLTADLTELCTNTAAASAKAHIRFTSHPGEVTAEAECTTPDLPAFLLPQAQTR